MIDRILRKIEFVTAIAITGLLVSQVSWSIGSAGSSASASGAAWIANLDQGSGSVEFHATGHPSALKIVGKGAAPHGSFKVVANHVSGSATMDLSSLDTGIDLRNRHMKEKYLETDKFPDAKLTIKEMALPPEASKEQFELDQIPFTGTLLLHGVEKPVSGFAKLKRDAKSLSILAQFGLKITDYQISVPKFAGITMADDVRISVTDQAPLNHQ